MGQVIMILKLWCNGVRTPTSTFALPYKFVWDFPEQPSFSSANQYLQVVLLRFQLLEKIYHSSAYGLFGIEVESFYIVF